MAERPIPVGMNTITVTNAAQEAQVLADMMQLELGQKTTDVIDQLTNTDFEGDFFRIGDTVQVVAIDPNSIKVVEGDKNDIRPTLDHVTFEARTMVIDKKREFAFQIRDLERLEDKWNHESAAHALAARKMREADCLAVLNLITKQDVDAISGSPIRNIACIGNFTTPAVDLTTSGGLTPEQKGNKLFRLINVMKQYLRQKGVIDGEQYKYGANKTVPLRGTASLFVAPGIHTALLNAQYVRYDDVTEDVIRNGKYEKIAGLLLNSAVSLDAGYAELGVCVDLLKDHPGFGLMILGTKNLVTRAGKVLPPEKMRDYVHFADNYYGREIYGQTIACPEAAIMAIVKLENEFTVNAFTEDGLFKQYEKESPVRANGYPTVTVNDFPQAANAQYLANNIPVDTYANMDLSNVNLGANSRVAAKNHGHTTVDITGNFGSGTGSETMAQALTAGHIVQDTREINEVDLSRDITLTTDGATVTAAHVAEEENQGEG